MKAFANVFHFSVGGAFVGWWWHGKTEGAEQKKRRARGLRSNHEEQSMALSDISSFPLVVLVEILKCIDKTSVFIFLIKPYTPFSFDQ